MRYLLAFLVSIILSVAVVPNVNAQIPFLPTAQPTTSAMPQTDSRVDNGWIYLDGRRIFQIAAPRDALSERLERIQRNLNQLSQYYFQSPADNINVQYRILNSLPVIYINDQYLMTVTSQDAKLREQDAITLANQISQTLQEDLQQAKYQRQKPYLIRQAQIATVTGFAIIITSTIIHFYQHRTHKRASQTWQQFIPTDQPLTTQLRQRQQKHFQEAQIRLCQLAQFAIWGSGTLFILGLFPNTRPLQAGIFSMLQVPWRLAAILLTTYVLIRISYALIDRFTSAIISSNALWISETSERSRLRISTILGVTKSIVTLTWGVIAILLALMSLGVDIVPLLAGAGLLGVAISLASQNLIKDAINGFLIILEDQYALGDVIAVGNSQGLVENLNLRITQLRDTEGRLITIPNSEVKVVANLSNRWSRADLKIPVAYQVNVDQALKLMETTAVEMQHDPEWSEQILETPRVLGVDNFGERGPIIRIWIKTQPLKQWDVAREFRRRLKTNFDSAGISIPLPQQAIWINNRDDEQIN